MLMIEDCYVDGDKIWALTPVAHNEEEKHYEFDVMVSSGTIKVKRSTLEEAEQERLKLAKIKADLAKNGEMLLG